MKQCAKCLHLNFEHSVDGLYIGVSIQLVVSSNKLVASDQHMLPLFLNNSASSERYEATEKWPPQEDLRDSESPIWSL